MGSPDQESGGKQFTETWLVLEYCDRGNLQDAVDRGVFVMQRGSQAAGTATEHNCNVRSVRWVSPALWLSRIPEAIILWSPIQC